MSEQLNGQPERDNRNDLQYIYGLTQAVRSHVITESSSDSWQEVPQMMLLSHVRRIAKVGKIARCWIGGDQEAGIGVIFRSATPINLRRYGFYIDPVPRGNGPAAYALYHGHAKRPLAGSSEPPKNLFNTAKLSFASPLTKLAFVQTLEQAAWPMGDLHEPAA